MNVLLMKELVKPRAATKATLFKCYWYLPYALVPSLILAGQGTGGSDHAAAGHPGENPLHQTEPLPRRQQHPQHTQLHRWKR